MRKLIKKIIRYLSIPFIFTDYLKFRQADDKRFKLLPRDFYPCVKDKTVKTNFDPHYIYHTAWAARKVREIKPARHTDISSSLYFSGIISAFIPVDFYDYRPADLHLDNFKSGAVDLTKLSFADNSLDSLSCMHTIEHIGLGRYGDPIDASGDLKAIAELKRVLAPGGSLLFVVPVGTTKIEFNAHRVYAYEMIREYFKELMLKEFSLVDDAGRFTPNASPESVKSQKYACGCFWFVK